MQSALAHDNNIAETPHEDKKGLLPIHSVTPFTMLDFPDKTACVVWFTGCNMRCGYCHNPELIKAKGRGSIDQVMVFLKKRVGLLDGVVISGGEASTYPGLPDFIKNIKKMGFLVKLDTNGIRPDVIEKFLADGLLDYVALDYKAPPHKFKTVTSVDKYPLFSKTLDILCDQKAVPFEVRTTVHTALLNENDIKDIIRDLEARGYNGTYYVQNFRADNDRPVLGNLDPQHRIFDVSALPLSHKMTIETRNF